MKRTTKILLVVMAVLAVIMMVFPKLSKAQTAGAPEVVGRYIIDGDLTDVFWYEEKLPVPHTLVKIAIVGYHWPGSKIISGKRQQGMIHKYFMNCQARTFIIMDVMLFDVNMNYKSLPSRERGVESIQKGSALEEVYRSICR